MKKSTRAAAVAATALLVASGAQGTANAQGSGDSSLPTGVSAQSVADAIGIGNIGGLVQSLLGTLTGSATGTAGPGGDLADGSSDLNPLNGSSEVPGSGDLTLPALSTSPLAGSSTPQGSAGFQPLGGSSQLTPGVLAGSLGTQPLSAEIIGDVGSNTLPPLSTAAPLGGSAQLPPLSAALPLGGSAALPAALIGSTDMQPLSTELDLLGGSADLPDSLVGSLNSPLTGSTGMGSTDMAPLSTELNLLGGSATLAPLGSLGMAPVVSSLGMEPLSTELNLLGGSAALPPLSANFPDGSTEGIGGSAGEVGEGISGSLTNGSAGDLTGPLGGSLTTGGALAPIIGSAATGGILPALSGSIESVSGSLAGDTGSTGQSSDLITGSTGGSAGVLIGSAGELTEFNGSLTALTGSLENGSLRSTASTNLGSDAGTLASVAGAPGIGSIALPLLSLGGTAAAVGVALNGGVTLPPLPSVYVPGICDLPHDMVDQLANAGSAIAIDCLHPENEGN